MAANRVLERMLATKDRLWRRWPTWVVIGLVVGYVLLQNALVTWTDKQIARLGPRMLKRSASLLTDHIPAFVVPMVLAILVLHAYWDTRPPRRLAPSEPQNMNRILRDVAQNHRTKQQRLIDSRS